MLAGKLRLIISSISALLFVPFAWCQDSRDHQLPDKSICSNVVALVGDVEINCSSLTPEQEKLLQKIPILLKEILAKQVDRNAVMEKMDEILRAVQANAILEPIQITATFHSPEQPTIHVTNPSDRVAEGVIWSLILLRHSDLAYFSFATTNLGYVKPHSTSLGQWLNLTAIGKESDGDGPLKRGDELTGSISIDCPKCQIRAYIIHLVWEESGWFYEPPGELGKSGYITPGDMSKEGRARYIQQLTSEEMSKGKIELSNRTR